MQVVIRRSGVSEMVADSAEEPILLVLSQEEKDLIANMGRQTKFCSYPPDTPKELVQFLLSKELEVV